MITILIFIISTIIHIINSFELTISLYLESTSRNPITFLRAETNSVFLSNDDSSLIYNFDVGAVGTFNSLLSNFSNSIIGFSYPEFYYVSDNTYEILYYRLKDDNNTAFLKCDVYEMGNSPPAISFSQRIKKRNSNAYVSSYFFGSDTKYLSIMSLDCFGLGYVKIEPTIEDSTKTLVLFISHVSHNISLLIIDDKYNTIRTYTREEFISYEYYNYTGLEKNIQYGESVALENGNFIFCYNTSNYIHTINCEILGFEDKTLHNFIPHQQIMDCPTERNKYFYITSLSNTKAIIGCGTNQLYIQIIDENLKFLTEPLIITDESLYSEFIFSPLSSNVIFIVGTLLTEDPVTNVYYKGDSIYFGFGEDTFDSLDNYNNLFSFYYSPNGEFYKRCSEYCLTCIEKNSQEHCIRCNNDKGYYIYQREVSTCVKEDTYIERFYLDMTLKAFVQCEKGWLVNSLNKVECYDICPYDLYLDPYVNHLCVIECDSYNPYKLNSTKECVAECDSNYPYKLNSTKECVSKCPESLILKDGYCIPLITSSTSEEEDIVVNIPKEEILSYIDISSFNEEGKNIIGDDFILQIYPMDSPIKENNNISSIDIGKCEGILRIENNIPHNESLLISKIDIKEDGAIVPRVEYKVYNSKGKQLDMSVCNGVPISVSYPLFNTDLIPLFEDASELSKRGFDVYNPKDSFYNDICSSYSNGTVDVVLKDRRKDIYVDVHFCQEGCVYEGINYTTNKVNCNCDGNNADIINFDDFGNSMFQQTNLILLKCYKQIIKKETYKMNIGVYFCGSIFVINYILVIIFCISGYNKVYFKYKAILDKFYYENSQFKQISTTEQSIDIDNVSFKQAVSMEDRNFFKFFFLLLFNQIEIIKVFFFSGDFDLLPISLSLFLFSIASDYTMNALLFSDDVISERYHNQGELNPLTTYALSFLSNLLGCLISYIAVKLTSFTTLLELLAIEHIKEKDYIQKLKEIMYTIKVKITLFFIYEISMMIVYLYFLSIFCSVYKASQWNWFTNGIMSNLLSFLYTVILSVTISVCRFIGIYCHSESIYNISLYLNH